MRAIVGRFGKRRRGAVLLIAVVIAPLLAISASGAISFAKMNGDRATLQVAADAAAIAAAKQLQFLSGGEDVAIIDGLRAAARSMVDANLAGAGEAPTTETVLIDENTVAVTVSRGTPVMLGHLVGIEALTAEARAVAQVYGGQDVCVVTLDETNGYTLDLNNDSRMTGPGCSIYSNSTHARAIVTSETSRIVADHICSSGGARGQSSSFTPRPTTDCPRLDDPLIDKIGPGGLADSMGTHCSGAPSSITTYNVHSTLYLDAGHHCGDHIVDGDTTLVLRPGIHVFENTRLVVQGNATLKGENVGLIFTGNNSTLEIHDASTIRLHGRETGDMAGMLIVAEPRPDGEQREIKFMSPEIDELVGTLYLPGDWLNVLTDQPVADRSAFTVIMARRIKLHGSAKLVLNRDYAATTVPKFPGLRDYGGGLRLSE